MFEFKILLLIENQLRIADWASLSWLSWRFLIFSAPNNPNFRAHFYQDTHLSVRLSSTFQNKCLGGAICRHPKIGLRVSHFKSKHHWNYFPILIKFFRKFKPDDSTFCRLAISTASPIAVQSTRRQYPLSFNHLNGNNLCRQIHSTQCPVPLYQ